MSRLVFFKTPTGIEPVTSNRLNTYAPVLCALRQTRCSSSSPKYYWDILGSLPSWCSAIELRDHYAYNLAKTFLNVKLWLFLE